MARKKEAQASALQAYEVTSPLNHDGELYAVGEPIELSDEQAAPLLGHTVKLIEPAAS